MKAEITNWLILIGFASLLAGLVFSVNSRFDALLLVIFFYIIYFKIFFEK